MTTTSFYDVRYSLFGVVKRNKRLYIKNIDSGELVYTPPDFIRLNSREPMQDLADELENQPDTPHHYIRSIMRFEAMYHPDRSLRIMTGRREGVPVETGGLNVESDPSPSSGTPEA